uniref:Uncharacterized protein n=1 Tax=Anguilla anguilla TaxID=7936 RepID=A0A0E9PJG5_ANGAN
MDLHLKYRTGDHCNYSKYTTAAILFGYRTGRLSDTSVLQDALYLVGLAYDCSSPSLCILI